MVFAKMPSAARCVRPPCEPTTSSWVERTFDGVRIRIDSGHSDGSDDARLVTIVPGDVLPSVSRRDARRATARIWTSGNRVFGCASPRALLEALDADAPLRLSQGSAQARRQVEALVRLEHGEYIRSEDDPELVDRRIEDASNGAGF